jgi:hypothetical protein
VIDPETPSALLRRAANHLDGLLAAMPKGSRRLEPHRRKGTDLVIQYDMHGPPPVGSNVPTHKVFHTSRLADAEYAMATQPDTMRDLVGMLRSAATMADGLPEANGVLIVRHALNAARRIVGEA